MMKCMNKKKHDSLSHCIFVILNHQIKLVYYKPAMCNATVNLNLATDRT